MSAQESDLYELSMSEESQPLMAAVKKHIEEKGNQEGKEKRRAYG